MQDTGAKSWWKASLQTLFVAVGFVAILVPLFWTDDAKTRWIVGLFVTGCGGLFAYSVIHDWRQDRRLRRLHRGRETLDPDTFANRFFSDVPHGPEAAAAMRRLLDEHLQRELGGLRPDDPLESLQDWIDPLFTDELTRRLDLPPPTGWQEFREWMERQRTIRDLVESLARKMGEARKARG